MRYVMIRAERLRFMLGGLCMERDGPDDQAERARWGATERATYERAINDSIASLCDAVELSDDDARAILAKEGKTFPEEAG